MPELPDINAYVHALTRRIEGATLDRLRIHSPFVLRSVEPPIESLQGRRVTHLDRIGKRVVIHFDGEHAAVIHLMIAGRLLYRSSPQARPADSPGRIPTNTKGGLLAAFEFSAGTLFLTEAGTTKRASIHLVHGEHALEAHRPGGIEVISCSLGDFAARLRLEQHTVKRALTTPQLFSGIGNAYSDEILHAAKLSPVKLTRRLSDDEISTLHAAAQRVLVEASTTLSHRYADRFPGVGEVTAFRPEFAVHGKFAQPCPVCAAPVQRIVYAQNETNYCPGCQTGGRVLADRSLSRLLRDDWPRSIDDL